MSVDKILEAIPTSAFRHHSAKFEPKLTFPERCAALALHRKSVAVPVIAAAFGINRRTVRRLVSADSPSYHSVRDEEKRMGTLEFIEKYLTEEVARRVSEVASSAEVDETQTEYDAKPRAERTATPSQRASGVAGINYFKPANASFNHRLSVEWLEANTAEDDNGPFEHPAGWYCRDMDSDTPERYMGNPAENTHVTSAKALAHAKQELGQ